MQDGQSGSTVVGLMRTAAVGGAISKAMDGRVDFRARSPAEIGEQLLRDAQSLELTGASFEKDEAFYRNVAANAREAANFLSQWHGLVDAIQRGAAARERGARMGGFVRAQEIAMGVVALVPANAGGSAYTWRIAGMAINEAIQAVRDNPNERADLEGIDLKALERELVERCREAGPVDSQPETAK